MLALRPGRVIAGKYRLDSELARGGMGSLWTAFDRRLRRKVAIKFIHGRAVALEEARARFEREARATAQIRSPHVVQTYDYGVDRNHPYIVMELLEGEDLGMRLARERRLPVATVTSILSQLAKGLDAVHAAGIIHRDLKPANVFVASVAGEETMKLIDFGVARTEEKDRQRTTGRGAVLGTVKYMAPEQALGDEQLDHRADLWSLAVLVYRLLTGKFPFEGATIDELVLAICRDSFTSPSSYVAGLPEGIDAFFKRAFARNPDRRFQSAQQMFSSFTAEASSRAARTGTLPWGTRGAAGAVPREAAAITTRVDRVKRNDGLGVDPALEESDSLEVDPAFPAQDSDGETRVMEDALPAPRPVLPSNYTPSPYTPRNVARGTTRKWWWLASIPVAALVVVGAVVFGITTARPPARVNIAPASLSVRDASSPAPATSAR